MDTQESIPKPDSIRSSIPQQFSSLPHTHTVRQMKEYVVTEAELYDISLLNSLTSAFFSLASGAALFGVGLYSSAVIQGSLSEKAAAFVLLGEWVGWILAVIFLGFGIWAWLTRRSKISDIKKQAVAIDQIEAIASRMQSTVSTVTSVPDSDREGSKKQ